MAKRNIYRLELYKAGFEKRLDKFNDAIQKILHENLVVLRNLLFDAHKIAHTSQKTLLAIGLGLNPSTIIKLEDDLQNKGAINFSFQTIMRIAAFYNVPVSVLFMKNGAANYVGLDKKHMSALFVKADESDKSTLRKDIRLIKNRVKQLTFYTTENRAFFKQPMGKIVELKLNSTVELKVNENYTFYIDVVKTYNTQKICFIHNIEENNIMIVNQIKPIIDMPDELLENPNATVGLILSVYNDYIIRVNYLDEIVNIKKFVIKA